MGKFNCWLNLWLIICFLLFFLLFCLLVRFFCFFIFLNFVVCFVKCFFVVFFFIWWFLIKIMCFWLLLKLLLWYIVVFWIFFLFKRGFDRSCDLLNLFVFDFNIDVVLCIFWIILVDFFLFWNFFLFFCSNFLVKVVLRFCVGFGIGFKGGVVMLFCVRSFWFLLLKKIFFLFFWGIILLFFKLLNLLKRFNFLFFSKFECGWIFFNLFFLSILWDLLVVWFNGLVILFWFVNFWLFFGLGMVRVFLL